MTDKYEIKVCYSTGDSFHTEDTSTVLEMTWNSRDNAKLALQRIKEHWQWYECEHKHMSGTWNDKLKKYVKPHEPSWHIGLDDHSILLMLDNGNDVKFAAPWCGYFESLQSVEIILDESDMKWEA